MNVYSLLTQAEKSESLSDGNGGDGPQRTRSPSVKPNRRRGKQTGEVFNFCVSLCQCVLIFRTHTRTNVRFHW